jgi:ferredoxin-type protein NapH
MRKYRNASRIAVIILMLLLVYFNLYEKKAGQLGAEKEIENSLILTAYDAVFGSENKPMLFRGHLEGGLWSFKIYGLSFSDPLAFIASIVTSLSMNLELLISIIIPALLIILLGRYFCSWICPYSLFAEAGNGIARILKKFGVEYFNFDLPKRSGQFFLVISMILGAIISIPITVMIYPPRILTEGIYHIVVAGVITWGVLFLVIMWLGEIVLSPHLFCRRICPGGALFSIIGKWRFWNVKRMINRCDNCGICNPSCPYHLQPAEGIFPGECDNCGLCIDACEKIHKNALVYTWGISDITKGKIKV